MIFAKVQHKVPFSKKNVLILTNRTDIGHNHLVENLYPKRIGCCCPTIADSEKLVRQLAPPMMDYFPFHGTSNYLNFWISILMQTEVDSKQYL